MKVPTSIVADLLAECNSHCIRLEPVGDGGLSIDAPQDILTPELMSRLKAHKAELLAFLERFEERAAVCDLPTDPAPELIGPKDWLANSIDPDELTPCAKCGTLELWESATDDLLGPTPGRWRCLKCDPPRLLDDWRKRQN